MNWTDIILGVLTLLSGCGWFVSGRKYRQEVKSQKADNRLKDMELAMLYVEQFEKNIAELLRQEVRELRDEVKGLRDAVQQTNDCSYSDDCPVRAGLRNKQAGK